MFQAVWPGTSKGGRPETSPGFERAGQEEGRAFGGICCNIISNNIISSNHPLRAKAETVGCHSVLARAYPRRNDNHSGAPVLLLIDLVHPPIPLSPPVPPLGTALFLLRVCLAR